ncbi:MAG TPA: Fic family protein [Stellaceae bacterium]|nr:Fic family protein [Stellaceae bacterium]
MRRLFSALRAGDFLRDRSAGAFATKSAHFLATLNAIHPFREGNGRTQTSFLTMLADRAGRPLNLEALVPARFLRAMVASFEGNEALLAAEIARLTE